MQTGKIISLIFTLTLAVSAGGASLKEHERTVRVRITCAGDPAKACKNSEPKATETVIQSLESSIPYFLYKPAEENYYCGILEIRVSRTPESKWQADIWVYDYQTPCPSTPTPHKFSLDGEVIDKSLESLRDENGLNAVTKKDFPKLLAQGLERFIDKNEPFVQSLRKAIPIGFGATFTIPPSSSTPDRSGVKGHVLIKPLPRLNFVDDQKRFAWAAYDINVQDVSLGNVRLKGSGCKSTTSGLEVELIDAHDPSNPAASDLATNLAHTRDNVLFLFTEGSGAGCQLSATQPAMKDWTR